MAQGADHGMALVTHFTGHERDASQHPREYYSLTEPQHMAG
jgi:hypothetical protein